MDQLQSARLRETHIRTFQNLVVSLTGGTSLFKSLLPLRRRRDLIGGSPTFRPSTYSLEAKGYKGDPPLPSPAILFQAPNATEVAKSHLLPVRGLLALLGASPQRDFGTYL